MSTALRPSGRGNIDEPVLPCQDLDVEVVSDIIEELADIEVEAKTEDNPDPDLDVVATVEESAAAAANPAAPQFSPTSEEAASPSGSPQPLPEPDYDVEVAVQVMDAGEPDLELTCVVTGDSNESTKGTESNA